MCFLIFLSMTNFFHTPKNNTSRFLKYLKISVAFLINRILENHTACRLKYPISTYLQAQLLFESYLFFIFHRMYFHCINFASILLYRILENRYKISMYFKNLYLCCLPFFIKRSMKKVFRIIPTNHSLSYYNPA